MESGALQEKEIRELAQENFCNPTGNQTYQLQNYSTTRHLPLAFHSRLKSLRYDSHFSKWLSITLLTASNKRSDLLKSA